MNAHTDAQTSVEWVCSRDPPCRVPLSHRTVQGLVPVHVCALRGDFVLQPFPARVQHRTDDLHVGPGYIMLATSYYLSI